MFLWILQRSTIIRRQWFSNICVVDHFVLSCIAMSRLKFKEFININMRWCSVGSLCVGQVNDKSPAYDSDCLRAANQARNSFLVCLPRVTKPSHTKPFIYLRTGHNRLYPKIISALDFTYNFFFIISCQREKQIFVEFFGYRHSRWNDRYDRGCMSHTCRRVWHTCRRSV